MLEVLTPGLLTTVQDEGRRGFLRFGLPRAGAADPFALALANLLVGNDRAAAGLECTASGPTLRARGRLLLAVAGACSALTVDGQVGPVRESFWLEPGAVLEVGPATGGLRSYVAVAGGIDVPAVLGSRSTYLRAHLGGLKGRPLRAGDLLPVGRPRPGQPARAPAGLPDRSGPLRVLLGPQDDHFTAAGLEALLGAEFRVTPQSDRMGIRLQGPPVTHARGADVVSDGVPPGSVQVPGNGQPIIVLVDGQPTGGYPKPAVLAGADLGRAGQLAPGARVRLAAVTHAGALAARREFEAYLARTRRLAARAAATRSFYMQVAGRPYRVLVEELE